MMVTFPLFQPFSGHRLAICKPHLWISFFFRITSEDGWFIQLIPILIYMETIGTLPIVIHLDHDATRVQSKAQNISRRRASHWHVFPTKIPHVMRLSCQVLAAMILNWKSLLDMWDYVPGKNNMVTVWQTKHETGLRSNRIGRVQQKSDNMMACASFSDELCPQD